MQVVWLMGFMNNKIIKIIYVILSMACCTAAVDADVKSIDGFDLYWQGGVNVNQGSYLIYGSGFTINTEDRMAGRKRGVIVFQVKNSKDRIIWSKIIDSKWPMSRVVGLSMGKGYYCVLQAESDYSGKNNVIKIIKINTEGMIAWKYKLDENRKGLLRDLDVNEGYAVSSSKGGGCVAAFSEGADNDAVKVTLVGNAGDHISSKVYNNIRGSRLGLYYVSGSYVLIVSSGTDANILSKVLAGDRCCEKVVSETNIYLLSRLKGPKVADRLVFSLEDSRVYSVYVDDDKSLVLAGWKGDDDNIWVAKLDYSGGILWEYHGSGSDAFKGSVRAIKVMRSKGYIVGGEDFEGRPFLIILDRDGKKISGKVYNGYSLLDDVLVLSEKEVLMVLSQNNKNQLVRVNIDN